MSFRDDPKGWARAQAEQLRSDPKAWARAQTDHLHKLVDVAPFSDEALTRELDALRGQVDRRHELTADQRQALHDALLDLHQRLSPSGAAVSGAKIGLAAAVLPLIGMITGPVLGGAYGVYRSTQLTRARDEVQDMLRKLARG